MNPNALLTIAYTPDSDDAFYYYGLETGRRLMPGFLPEFRLAPMSRLNAAALKAEYDVTIISSIIYPLIADRYVILSVGTSVGRGYGPVLVSRDCMTLEQCRGKRIGLGGIPSTGWLLMRWLCPDAVAVLLPDDQIAAAVAAGELDAGVMLHEELRYYPELGLKHVADLGAEWCARTCLPLPVSLNVARKNLGNDNLQSICASIRASLQFALNNRPAALKWVSRLGRGKDGQRTQPFVEMFANTDSLALADDVRLGLRRLLALAVQYGVGTSAPALEIIEGDLRANSAQKPIKRAHREVTRS